MTTLYVNFMDIIGDVFSQFRSLTIYYICKNGDKIAKFLLPLISITNPNLARIVWLLKILQVHGKNEF